MTRIAVESHPLLRPGAFVAELPRTLAEMPSPPWLIALLSLEAPAPLARDEEVRARVRDALRANGYKPTGRGKPASEYLVRAATEGALAPINLAVDACNAVSLHSALPASVVDFELLTPPLAIRLGSDSESYVFNAAGQTIELAGLVCLCDAHGPCATPVKDSQRTKAFDGARRTLSIVWGALGLEERLARTLAWYREILERCGATTRDVELERSAATPAPEHSHPREER